MSTTPEEKRRPEDGYWAIKHWERAKPHTVDLRGQFTSGELRWLADMLDQHNAGLEDDVT